MKDDIQAFYAVAKLNHIEQSDEFLLWKQHFDFLHGGIKNLKSAEKNIADEYGLQCHDPDIELLIYVVETMYALDMEIKTRLLIECQCLELQAVDADWLSALFTYSSPFKRNLNAKLYCWPLQFEQLRAVLLSYAKSSLADRQWMSPEVGDICQSLYHRLFSKKIRHSIGAYFTPEWVAELLLENIESELTVNKKIIEPTCGSGVFILALARVLLAGGETKHNLNEFLCHNFIGFELSPVSVLASELNWLRVFLAVCPMTALENDSITVPVYLRNCISQQGGDDGVDYFSSGLNEYDFTSPCHDVCQAYHAGLELSPDADLIVGNPPWINWETLDARFREAFAEQWPELGLFAQAGTSKAFSKEDMSTFVLYFCAEHMLKAGGEIAFLMPQGIFQSAKNSRGFRQFHIKCSDTDLKVNHVLDFSSQSVFYQATTRAAIVSITKGKKTKFPVNYQKVEKINALSSLWFSAKQVTYSDCLASPIDSSDEASVWMIFPEAMQATLRLLEGKPHYRARTGMFTGGANAVYYVEILEDKDESYSVINLTERAKVKVEQTIFDIEKSALKPFARGRDVGFWRYESDDRRAVIFPHEVDAAMAPIAEADYQHRFPFAFSYLSKHKALLLNRGGLTVLDHNSLSKGFYTLLRVGEYTFSEYKVVWKYICKEFTCCVLGPQHLLNGDDQPLVPQEKLMSISVASKKEAYFLCGYLSSLQIKAAVEARMVSTQISAHVIADIFIPAFDEDNSLHLGIAALCEQGHQVQDDNKKAVLRNDITELVGQLLAAKACADTEVFNQGDLVC